MPDPPSAVYADNRAAIEAQFPGFGWYHSVSKVRPGDGEAEVEIGDALDDLPDIQADLEAFLWRWDHNSKDDALFNLWTLMPHWMSMCGDCSVTCPTVQMNGERW